MKTNRIISVLSFLALGLAFFTSCESETAVPAEKDDFQSFYDRFLHDEAYQMEHIVFPLEGIPAGAETEEDLASYKWEREDWTVHRPMDPVESGFISEFVELEPGLIAERIVHQSGRYGMMRRFARLGSDWYLIYYAGMNALEVQ